MNSIAAQVMKSRWQQTLILTVLLLPVAATADTLQDAHGLSNSEHQTDAAEAGKPSDQKRLLPLNNTRNTRDLGGYSTANGRRLKWGLLFRSDSLADLDASDLAYLERLQLAAVTDLRSEAERVQAPSQLPRQSPTIAYQTLDINDPAINIAELSRKFFSGQLSETELIALTDRTSYISNTAISRTWGQWVADLANPGALPHLFHCTAGKDRTGFASAIILLTLGVPKAEIMHDFLLTNQYLDERIEATVKKIQANSTTHVNADVLRQVIGVTPNSLENAFAAMEDQYGSIDLYIEQGLGIDKATQSKLRALLLE